MTQFRATTRVGMGRGRGCSIGELAWRCVQSPARPIVLGDPLREGIPPDPLREGIPPPAPPEDPHLPRLRN